jgi:hypothetical protein
MAVNTNFGHGSWKYFLLFEILQKQESQGELLLSGGRLCFVVYCIKDSWN